MHIYMYICTQWGWPLFWLKINEGGQVRLVHSSCRGEGRGREGRGREEGREGGSEGQREEERWKYMHILVHVRQSRREHDVKEKTVRH